MRIAIASFLHEHEGESAIARHVAFARAAEAAGLAGLWVADAMGRGIPTLDPLIALAAAAAVTERIELGVGVLQVPLRPSAVELAHRIQSLQVLSGRRLCLGVGAGSTRGDFTLVGADFESRFATLKRSLATMREVWRGESVNGGRLSPWKAAGDGPPIVLGSWRSPSWIAYAAEACDGWIASALYGRWEGIEAGISSYRKAGGKRAILTNIPFDPSPAPRYAVEQAGKAEITLAAAAPRVRETLKRIADLGFDDVVLLPPEDATRYVEMAATFL